MLHHVFWYKLTDISEVLTASVISAVAISASETSVIALAAGIHCRERGLF
jgi:hypothetical protein